MTQEKSTALESNVAIEYDNSSNGRVVPSAVKNKAVIHLDGGQYGVSIDFSLAEQAGIRDGDRIRIGLSKDGVNLVIKKDLMNAGPVLKSPKPNARMRTRSRKIPPILEPLGDGIPKNRAIFEFKKHSNGELFFEKDD